MKKPLNNKTALRQRVDHHYYYHHVDDTLRGKQDAAATGWCILIWFVLIAVLFVVAFAYHWERPYYYYHHPSSSGGGTKKLAPESCTAGELWDSRLRLCTPETPTPLPVVQQLMDMQVPPCTSFYHHMCGAWINTHNNQDLSFTYAVKRNQALIQDIVRDPKSGPVYALYRSCKDTLVHNFHSREDALQRKHILNDIVGDFRGIGDLAVTLGRLNHYGFTSPFSFSVEKHPTQTALVPLLRPDGFSFETSAENVTQYFEGAGIPLQPERLRSLLDMLTALDAWRNPEAEPRDYGQYISSGQLDEETITFAALMDFSHARGGDLFWVQFLRELDGHGLGKQRPQGFVYIANVPLP